MSKVVIRIIAGHEVIRQMMGGIGVPMRFNDGEYYEVEDYLARTMVARREAEIVNREAAPAEASRPETKPEPEPAVDEVKDDGHEGEPTKPRRRGKS